MNIDIGDIRGLLLLDDEFSGTLDIAANKLKQFDVGIATTASVVVAFGATIVGALGGAATAVIDLGMKGSTLNDVAQSFESLANAAGFAGEQLLGPLREGTRGAVGDMELMQSTNAALSAGVKFTAEDMRVLGESARAMGKAFGTTTAQGMDQLTQALARGNARSLARVGITINSMAAEKKYAASIGTTREQLSAAGQLEAKRVAIMDELRARIDRTGITATSFKEKMQAAEQSVGNWIEGLQMAVAASPAVLGAFDRISAAVEQAFGPHKQRFIESMLGWVENLANMLADALVPMIEKAGVVVLELWDFLSRLNEEFHLGEAMWAALATAGQFVAASFERVVQVFRLMEPIIERLFNGVRIFWNWLVDLNEEYQITTRMSGLVDDAFRLLEDALNFVIAASDQAVRTWQELPPWLQDIAKYSLLAAAGTTALGYAAESAISPWKALGSAFDLPINIFGNLTSGLAGLKVLLGDTAFARGLAVIATGFRLILGPVGLVAFAVGALATLFHKFTDNWATAILYGMIPPLGLLSMQFDKSSKQMATEWDRLTKELTDGWKTFTEAIAGTWLETALNKATDTLLSFFDWFKGQILDASSEVDAMMRKQRQMERMPGPGEQKPGELPPIPTVRPFFGRPEAVPSVLPGTIPPPKLPPPSPTIDPWVKIVESLSAEFRQLSLMIDHVRANMSNVEFLKKFGAQAADLTAKARELGVVAPAGLENLAFAYRQAVLEGGLLETNMAAVARASGEMSAAVSAQGAAAMDLEKKYVDAFLNIRNIQEQTEQARLRAAGHTAQAEFALLKQQERDEKAALDRSSALYQETFDAITAKYKQKHRELEDTTTRSWKNMEQPVTKWADIVGNTLNGISGLMQDAFTGGGKTMEAMFRTTLATATSLGSQIGSKLFAPKTIEKDAMGNVINRTFGGVAGLMDKGVKKVGNLFGPKVGKMLSGAFGAALPGIGSAIGALAGPMLDKLVGALKPPGWKKIMNEVGRDWGVEISQELAEKIEADSKKIGDRAAAILKNISAVIGEAGGVAKFGYDKAIKASHDLFSAVETGFLKSEEAAEEFMKIFPQLMTDLDKMTQAQVASMAELIPLSIAFGVSLEDIRAMVAGPFSKVFDAVLGAGGLVPAGFADMITKAREAGVEVKKVMEFMKVQAQNIAAGLATFTAGAFIATAEAARALGAAANIAFLTMLANGVPLKEALAAMKPAIDGLRAAFDAANFSGGGAFAALTGLADAFTHKVRGPMLEAVLGVNQVLQGLHNTGQLTQGMFVALADNVTKTFDKLVKGGMSGKQAMRAMQPTLQTIWELTEKHGMAVDDNTQKLLDEAEANGIVGEKFMSTNEQMVDGINKVVDLLKQLIVGMGIKLRDSIKDVGDETNSARGEFEQFGEDGEHAAERAGAAMDRLKEKIDRATYGSSPGGLVDLIRHADMMERAITGAAQGSSMALEGMYQATLPSVGRPMASGTPSQGANGAMGRDFGNLSVTINVPGEDPKLYIVPLTQRALDNGDIVVDQRNLVTRRR